MKRFKLTFALMLIAGLAPLQAQPLRSYTTIASSIDEGYNLEELDQAFALQVSSRWALMAGGEVARAFDASDPSRAGVRAGVVRIINHNLYLEGILGHLAYYEKQELASSNIVMEVAFNAEKREWYFCLRDKVIGDKDLVTQTLSATWSLYPEEAWRVNSKATAVVDPEAGVSPSLRLDGWYAPLGTLRELGFGLGGEGDLLAQTALEGDGYWVTSSVFGYILYAPHFGTGLRFTVERYFGERNSGMWKMELQLRLPF